MTAATIFPPSVNGARTAQTLEGRVEEKRQSAVQTKIKSFMAVVVIVVSSLFIKYLNQTNTFIMRFGKHEFRNAIGSIFELFNNEYIDRVRLNHQTLKTL